MVRSRCTSGSAYLAAVQKRRRRPSLTGVTEPSGFTASTEQPTDCRMVSGVAHEQTWQSRAGHGAHDDETDGGADSPSEATPHADRPTRHGLSPRVRSPGGVPHAQLPALDGQPTTSPAAKPDRSARREPDHLGPGRPRPGSGACERRRRITHTGTGTSAVNASHRYRVETRRPSPQRVRRRSRGHCHEIVRARLPQ